ncbi:hypothetical protein TL16_g08731 [Triparma laevis f. inornata]|uniref:MYND-type domain-containing protein n=1 Tax=Triparma laevis f. inornata TaxID=1714386 RepID=A0A9W7AXR8_9STRA|nr:hypothetical protein TL16_g08731 [Triparma laevis f. inornata]
MLVQATTKLLKQGQVKEGSSLSTAVSPPPPPPSALTNPSTGTGTGTALGETLRRWANIKAKCVSELESMKVDELKCLCRDTGLKVSGKKAELINRCINELENKFMFSLDRSASSAEKKKSLDALSKMLAFMDKIKNNQLFQCDHPDCEENAPLLCRRCREEMYCCKEHQTADWKAHKKLCCVSPELQSALPKLRLSLEYLWQLTSGTGFNEFFQTQFDGNESTYLRWKSVFEELYFPAVKDRKGDFVKRRVGKIWESNDLTKLRALAKLFSPDFIHDPELWLKTLKRISKFLESSYVNRLFVDSNLGDIFADFVHIAKAESSVGNVDESMRRYRAALVGVEEQLRPESEQSLKIKLGMIIVQRMSDNEKIAKFHSQDYVCC